MYDQETILKEIRTKWAGKTVHFAKETDSTNEWAKRLSQEARLMERWLWQNFRARAKAVWEDAGRRRKEVLL